MAKGSQATYGGWESKTCADCGRKVVLSKGSYMFHFDHLSKKATTICEPCLSNQRDMSRWSRA